MKYFKLLLFSFLFSSCDITDLVKPTLNSCSISEDSNYFSAKVSCVDLLVDIGQANEAKQLCVEWGGDYVPSKTCPSDKKKTACEYEASSPYYKGKAVAWHKNDINEEEYNEFKDECRTLSGTTIELDDFEEKMTELSDDFRASSADITDKIKVNLKNDNTD